MSPRPFEEKRSAPSDLAFITSLADKLDWTATTLTAPRQGDLAQQIPDSLLRDSLRRATAASLLTTPTGIRLLAVSLPAEGLYVVGPLLPDGFPPDEIAAHDPWTPRALTISTTEPDFTTDIRFLAERWAKHLALVQAMHDPQEALRRDHSFTSYSDTVADALPGSWESSRLPLDSVAWAELRNRLWDSEPRTGQALTREAARVTLLSDAHHNLVLIQDSGPYQRVTAAAVLPTDPYVAPDALVPGPAFLALPLDAHEAADEITTGFLPALTRAVWAARVTLLAHATAELHQTLHSWNAVSATYTDSLGGDEQYDAATRQRDRRAMDAVDVYLTHAPTVLNGIESAATGADRLTGPIRDDLRELDALRHHLTGTARIRQAVDNALHHAPPEELPLLLKERGYESWSHAVGLAMHGDAMLRAARRVTSRVGTPQPPPEELPARRPTPTPVPPAPRAAVSPSRRGR
ncbi:hypothetical protein [Streptomyces acidiscabies]|uniref:Uncharacterized protein n=1 Tax=Streptomyces acidiscabies TaxID=42234 RepID=A0AAP6EMU6_9ACTN|nr:hypothetical protein [Streptomyces acidiscabies]MBP5936698.1 hypothetical protein [Streptomyces sp. LBUM 1476]MBZ3915305.1 hypothetical protein [Streptomyces acidiscabies]MDX2967415.1 hypothetical protein [Streptomyces acidiscabies]MDX3026052.1 hypothetical protein [Streptomyces acidiscabies]MDX3797027.1 hypothetical protein [Streptomyces acidiscabies]